uniref:Uncharacterized protein n=1 Tax=Arundo donax TaxID=35708 RepID=A0A0A8ZNK0_ARUDO
MDPSGFNLRSQAGGSFLGSSPDIRRIPHFSHGGIRLSPGGPGPMSLGASPSQFTPPNSQMQIPTGANGKYGTSPARGGHGSSLGKAAAVGQYNRRRNQGYPPMPVPPHEHASQLIQGHQGDVINAARFDAYGRGSSGYLHNALPNSAHFSWRPQRGVGSGLPSDPSSSHGSFPPTNYNGFPPLHSSDVSADILPPTSSIPDPADWDPNYSDESLLQEDDTLSADLSGLQLTDASGQTNRSSRLAPVQSHDISSSNPSSFNQRSEHLFHASSLRGSTHPTGHVTFDGYNHANYSQQSFPNYRGQPFQPYNNMTSSYIRPMRFHHNDRPVWTNYSLAETPPTAMGEGMPWGGRASHSFATSRLPPSIARKDFGRIY